MSIVRVNYMPEFYFGANPLLVTLDGGGVNEMRSALDEALREVFARRTFGGVVHEFHLAQSGAASVGLSPTHVQWRVDSAKTPEIIDGLIALTTPERDDHSAIGGCHYYIDMVAPAETLVLSRDEYVDVEATLEPVIINR